MMMFILLQLKRIRKLAQNTFLMRKCQQFPIMLSNIFGEQTACVKALQCVINLFNPKMHVETNNEIIMFAGQESSTDPRLQSSASAVIKQSVCSSELQQ